MGSISNIWSSYSVLIAPPQNKRMMINSACYSFVSIAKSKLRFKKINCTLPETESGIEHNPTSTRASSNSRTNKMEEYNIAMKKMMRNPYEYHHDLGQLSSTPYFFLINNNSHFIAIQYFGQPLCLWLCAYYLLSSFNFFLGYVCYAD